MTRFTNLGGLDPAVNLLIDQGDRRQAEAHFPKVKRSLKKKERERAQKRKPHRPCTAIVLVAADFLFASHVLCRGEGGQSFRQNCLINHRRSGGGLDSIIVYNLDSYDRE